MILYKKRKNYSIRNHVVTDHKSIFSHFVSHMDGWPNIVAGDNDYSLEGSVDTPISRLKFPNDESSCTNEMANYFERKKVMVLIILIRWIMMITWWRWWHTPTHLCRCWRGNNYSGFSLTLIRPFELSIGINWQVTLFPRNWIIQKQMFLHCLMVWIVL